MPNNTSIGFPLIDSEGQSLHAHPVWAVDRYIDPLPDDCKVVAIGTWAVGVPDGVGKFEVATRCGKLRGEMSIVPSGSRRGVDWICLCGERKDDTRL